MNTFNKKSLCVALAATGMLGAAGVAQAVNVSENGLGNVLIYPYYTVNKRHQRQLVQHADVGRQHDRPARKRSRSASAKARTARKCWTSTSSCRRLTSGLRRSRRA